MTLPNDSFVRTADGTGTAFATHTVGGKEYPIVISANAAGHMEGSLDTWLLSVPPQALAASKRHFDIYNATTSNILKIRGAWVVVAVDVANTAAVGPRFDWARTSAVGTAGTAAVSGSASLTAPTFAPKDTLNTALPAGVTARAFPTGGATIDDWLFATYHHTEELHVAAALSQFNNVMPNPERGEQELTLRPNQGFLCQQGSPVTAAGNVGFLVTFTIE